MINQMLDVSGLKGWVIMQTNERMIKTQAGMKIMSPLP